jgi:hypothetical protein
VDIAEGFFGGFFNTELYKIIIWRLHDQTAFGGLVNLLLPIQSHIGKLRTHTGT